MEVIKTELDGLLILKPKTFEDNRGFFLESYKKESFLKFGISDDFVQDNHSRSLYGVLRGLHYQKKQPQSQLISIMRGEIFDVVVDLRKNSKTFCKCFSIILKDSDHIQIYMPPGFAHGFCVLSEIADIHYKVSQYYNPDHEAGIIWNDSKLSIRWPLKNPIITQRDSLFPQIQDIDILNLPL